MKVMRLASLMVALLMFRPGTALAKDAAATANNWGWSQTQFAGKASGEIGGTVSSSATPLYYAAEIAPKGLKDELKASGSIALPAQGASKSAVFVGWFNSEVKGWRFPTCMGFWIGGDDSPNGEIFTYALSDSWNRAQGAKPTGLRVPRDGSRHTWTLTYSPEGNGAISFALDGGKPFTANLPPNHMAKGATFNRFGLLQAQASSNPFTLYLDDVQFDSKTQDFTADPGWTKGGATTRSDPDFSKGQRLSPRTSSRTESRPNPTAPSAFTRETARTSWSSVS
jgi:hypothetical protein